MKSCKTLTAPQDGDVTTMLVCDDDYCAAEADDLVDDVDLGVNKSHREGGAEKKRDRITR